MSNANGDLVLSLQRKSTPPLLVFFSIQMLARHSQRTPAVYLSISFKSHLSSFDTSNLAVQRGQLTGRDRFVNEVAQKIQKRIELRGQ